MVWSAGLVLYLKTRKHEKLLELRWLVQYIFSTILRVFNIVLRFKIWYINICNVLHRNLYLMMEEISLEVTYKISILRVPVECFLFVFKEVQGNTRHLIMFSVITNINNNKTKWPTLMELFTATGKLKKFFLTTRDIWCVHHGWHGTHWYNIQVLASHASTWVHQYSSLLQWSVPCTNGLVCRRVLCVLCTECTLHSNHRLTCVIFQHTKQLLPQSGYFLTTYTCIT
jgi:hypothetical protein